MIDKVLSFLVSWKTRVFVVLVLFSLLFAWHKALVYEAVTAAVAEIHTQQTKENFRLEERSLDARIALQESFDKIQKEKDVKIKSLNSRVTSLTNSLRERPSRAESSRVSDDPKVGEIRPEGTGLGLYREDSEFLLGEATRAELIKEELLTCYRSYDTAREALEKFKADNTPSKP